jgi:RNA polymerase-binding transcription factor DksA
MVEDGFVDGHDPAQPTPEPDVAPQDGGGGLDLARLAAAERDLADVEHALSRLDQGAWGTCEACGAAIDPHRLERRPAARTCAEHG